MIEHDPLLTFADLRPALQRFWRVSGEKIRALCANYTIEQGSPVLTVRGEYVTRGWTEWTQGFQYGWAILQFDATGDEELLEIGRQNTVKRMAPHISHIGVHDHGFNNISTYGNLRRLMLEGRIAYNEWELAFYELAIKLSGAVQAVRWSTTVDGTGFVYSFNGPQSLFIDTVRSMRALMLSHALGHRLMGENDESFSLLRRAVEHIDNTARYNVFYGEGRDAFDVRGRIAHESIFNVNDGKFRCSSSQQGYSGLTTWTRGLAWAITGFAEQLEFLETLADAELDELGGRDRIEQMMLKAARAACDFYIEHTPTDGVPYWDTGAPGLVELGDYLDRPSDPFNRLEPVDSSAAAIAAQGLLRLGRFLSRRGDGGGERYTNAGLVVLRSLLDEPYLATDPAHQGLLLHGVYHRPRGWDYEPDGDGVPRGEAVMWGDYHLVEVALLVQRLLDDAPYYSFFGGAGERS